MFLGEERQEDTKRNIALSKKQEIFEGFFIFKNIIYNNINIIT